MTALFIALSEAPSSSVANGLVALFLVGFLGMGAWFYSKAFGQLASGAGKVRTPYQFADIPTAVVLILWLGLAAIGSFQSTKEDAPMSEADLLNSSALFLFLVVGIAVFLKARHISLRETFGLNVVSPFKAIALGTGYLLAAYPIILLCSLAMQHWLGEDAEPQKILDFFKEAAATSNYTRIVATAALGVIVAPLAEEVIFRGYLYGVLRRYIGPLGGMLLCSALFSGIHGNLFAAPALFALAICLTLAYERTGSLLVPMVMHAIFNSVTLGVLFLRLT